MSSARAKVGFIEEDIGDLCAVDLPPLPQPCAKGKPQETLFFFQPVSAATEDQSSPMDCSPD
jgi:hypothetical protein